MFRLGISLLALLAGSVSAFAAVDSALLALLPSDTQTVASMNVDASRSSTFGQFMLRQMSTNDQSFQDMITQTGFDPRRDLQAFVLATVPAASTASGQSQSRFVVLARGVFNQAMITTHATAKGMVATTIGGTPVLQSTSGSPVALAFLEAGLAAFGDQSSIQQVLNNRANPSTLSSDLQAQISYASANNDAWFASTVPANTLASHIPDPSGVLGGSQANSQVMQAVLESSGGIQFGSNVQLSFSALTRSDQDATSLTDLIRLVSSMVQMQRQNDPRAALLAPAMDNMKLRADGRQVYSSVVIAEADLEQLVASQSQLSGHAVKLGSSQKSAR